VAAPADLPHGIGYGEHQHHRDHLHARPGLGLPRRRQPVRPILPCQEPLLFRAGGTGHHALRRRQHHAPVRPVVPGTTTGSWEVRRHRPCPPGHVHPHLPDGGFPARALQGHPLGELAGPGEVHRQALFAQHHRGCLRGIGQRCAADTRLWLRGYHLVRCGAQWCVRCRRFDARASWRQPHQRGSSIRKRTAGTTAPQPRPCAMERAIRLVRFCRTCAGAHLVPHPQHAHQIRLPHLLHPARDLPGFHGCGCDLRHLAVPEPRCTGTGAAVPRFPGGALPEHGSLHSPVPRRPPGAHGSG
jgi:hypothetical protein